MKKAFLLHPISSALSWLLLLLLLPSPPPLPLPSPPPPLPSPPPPSSPLSFKADLRDDKCESERERERGDVQTAEGVNERVSELVKVNQNICGEIRTHVINRIKCTMCCNKFNIHTYASIQYLYVCMRLCIQVENYGVRLWFLSVIRLYPVPIHLLKAATHTHTHTRQTPKWTDSNGIGNARKRGSEREKAAKERWKGRENKCCSVFYVMWYDDHRHILFV